MKEKKTKRQKKLTAKQIKELKAILIEKRNDLLSIVERKKHRDLPDIEIGDEIDTASMSVEKEMLFELTNNEKVMLDSIEAALRKIEKNKYGYCESCGKIINFSRLKTLPWARYCITCQEKFEKPPK
ncbi:MAG: TraR/DksA family transcriptional regulator [Endomicrobiia bacterium]